LTLASLSFRPFHGLPYRGAFALALLIVALALAGCGSGGTSHRASGGPIEVGMIVSLTGGGDVYGPQQLSAARLAAEQINARGGIGGREMRLVPVDDQSSPDYGRRLMGSLIEKQKVVAVIGPTLSVVAVAADPVANALRTPVLAVSNTAGGIVGRCAYPCSWVWRDSLGEATAVPANISDFLAANHTARAAVLETSPDVLGADEAALAQHSFGAAGVSLAANVVIPNRASAVPAAVTRVLGSQPDAIFIATTYGAIAAQAMREARADGFRGVFLGGSAFNSASTGATAGSASAGALSGSAWYAGNDFPANASFVSTYKDAYGAEPDQFAAQAYTGVEIISQALKHAGVAQAAIPLAQERKRLQESLGGVALTTPLGPFRFTRAHDVDQIVWIRAMNGSGGATLAGFCDPGCAG
jgi:branched-chain amino acid transport system substrate-binding protein